MLKINASEVASVIGENFFRPIDTSVEAHIYQNNHLLKLSDQEIFTIRTPKEKQYEYRSSLRPEVQSFLQNNRSVAKSSDEAKQKVDSIRETLTKNSGILLQQEKEVIQEVLVGEYKNLDKLPPITPAIAKIKEPKKTLEDDDSAIRTVQPSQQDLNELRETLTLSNLKCEQIEELIKMETSDVSTDYGIQEEASAIDKYEKQTGEKVIDCNNRYYKLTYDNFVVIGKVDGITFDENNEKIVVEVKNRLKPPKYKIPEYDYVQTLVYMKMLNVKKCRFVEKYNQTIKISTIVWNEDKWSSIEYSLQKYCNLIHKMILNTTLRHQFLSLPSSTRVSWVEQNLHI